MDLKRCESYDGKAEWPVESFNVVNEGWQEIQQLFGEVEATVIHP